MNKVVTFIANIGVEPGDSPELRLRKSLVNFTVVVCGFVFVMVIGPLYFHFQEPVAGALYAGYALFFLAGLAWLALQPRIFRAYLFLLLALAMVAILAATLTLGGFMNSSGLPIWGMLVVLQALIQYGPRPSLYWLTAFLSIVLISVALHPLLRPANNLPQTLVMVLFVLNLILLSGVAFFTLYHFIGQRDRAFALLDLERQKSENLLLNILPKEIVDVLKGGRGAIADHYDAVSILFADVVDFTPLSERMTPTGLVELLNEVFSHFDALAEKHGLEKIKTIGDCYMVAAGIPRPRADHAQALVRMALEMRDYSRQREFAGRGLIFRMGINSGSVVAGVIGKKKFIYDLWGDAVNTASRMESHGVAGAVQITEATYDLIHKDFVCEPQGSVRIKGKGEMKVWHVIGEKI